MHRVRVRFGSLPPQDLLPKPVTGPEGHLTGHPKAPGGIRFGTGPPADGQPVVKQTAERVRSCMWGAR